MKFRYISFLAIAALVVACTSDLESKPDGVVVVEPSSSDYIQYGDAIQGRLTIRVSEELAEKIESARVTKAPIEQALQCDAIAALGVSTLERTFPYAGRFEERTRREGMHRWYNVTFDDATSNTRAASSLLDVEGVEFVEDKRQPCLKSGPLTPYNPANVATRSESSAEAVFDDPMLAAQWHYANRANVPGFVESMDINVEPLWRSGVTGSSAILVGVVDGGADFSHPDLKDNLYVNEAELNGVSGVDDDGNGVMDDVYGFNFVSNNTEIIPHDHGTHVCGTVAARNNNGIGVAGVAGGDGTEGSGVKMLVCQIFEHSSSGQDVVGDGAWAIKYSADTGAIISQNSWGYPQAGVAEVDKQAIDYFVKYAGIDENGNQVGPLKGGIVIFAAGNDNVSYSNPGEYESTVAVTAIAPDGMRAPYSNYGEWADIAAPGGEQVRWEPYIGGVLSTVPVGKYDDDYGYYTGTSMACPHVSGVVALYLSKMYAEGKTDGLTPDVVIERLLNSTRSLVDFEPNDYMFMGRGLIDASRFVGIESDTVPSEVENLSVEECHYTSLDLKWSKPQNAMGYTLYCSESSLEGLDADNMPSDVSVIDVNKSAVNGDVSYSVINLQPSTKYYLAIRSWDYAGNVSEISSSISAVTEVNQTPIFYKEEQTIASDKILLSPEETPKMVYTIADPDGDKVIYEHVAGSSAESAMYNEDTQTITLFINGSKAPAGTYTATFKAGDKYGALTVFEVEYIISPNMAPEVVQTIDDLIFDELGKSRSIALSRYIVDKDGKQAPTFTASSSDSAIVVCEIVDNTSLKVTTKGYGVATVTVTATDKIGGEVSTQFMVTCGNDDDYSVVLYPNPVSTTLNIKSEALSLEELIIYDSNGVEVLSTTDLTKRRVDVSALSRGVYSVAVVVAGKSNILNITKL